MKKKKLKVGDFVRRSLHSGTPIGGICVVDDIEGSQVYVHHIPEDEQGSFAIMAKEVYQMKVAKLSITNEDAKHLVEKRPYAFSRTPTIRWEECAKEHDYDLAVFTAPNGTKIIVRDVYFWQQPKMLKGNIAVRWQTYTKIFLK